MTECEGKVLVEEVLEELAHAQVRPSTVHEQQALEKAELSDRKVAGEDSLQTFLTADAHADVRSCNK